MLAFANKLVSPLTPDSANHTFAAGKNLVRLLLSHKLHEARCLHKDFMCCHGEAFALLSRVDKSVNRTEVAVAGRK